MVIRSRKTQQREGPSGDTASPWPGILAVIAVTLGALGTSLLIFASAGCGTGKTAEGIDTDRRTRAENLYRQCTGELDESDDPEFRMNAARKLVQLQEGGPWVVLILADPTAVEHPGDETWEQDGVRESIRKQREPFLLSIVYAVLTELPKDTSKAVLFAVTTRLDEEGKARFSTRRWRFPAVIVGDSVTPPIREVARKTLTLILGVDHGYDVWSWRRAILKARLTSGPDGRAYDIPTSDTTSASDR